MTALVNEADIRRFVAIISAHVVKIGAPGVLQIDTL
jgi:hypothetical protein